MGHSDNGSCELNGYWHLLGRALSNGYHNASLPVNASSWHANAVLLYIFLNDSTAKAISWKCYFALSMFLVEHPARRIPLVRVSVPIAFPRFSSTGASKLNRGAEIYLEWCRQGARGRESLDETIRRNASYWERHMVLQPCLRMA